MSTRLKVGFVSVLSCLALVLGLFASTGIASAHTASAQTASWGCDSEFDNCNFNNCDSEFDNCNFNNCDSEFDNCNFNNCDSEFNDCFFRHHFRHHFRPHRFFRFECDEDC